MKIKNKENIRMSCNNLNVDLHQCSNGGGGVKSMKIGSVEDFCEKCFDFTKENGICKLCSREEKLNQLGISI